MRIAWQKGLPQTLIILFATIVGHPSHAGEQSFALVSHGKSLVDAGDCVACHTNETGKPFAGGRPIVTPFGTIYSPNLTPDRETGIGGWSDEDFYTAMHTGVAPDGSRLYPAFPYPYFSRISHSDVLAIRAYLNTLEPVRSAPPANQLWWPLNYRVFMRGWDLLFFKPSAAPVRADKSEDWNRGAYLVEGLGHCGACHTPKNFLGADKTDEALKGGKIQNWFAPNITNGAHNGLGTWSVEEIAEYLKTGRNTHSGAGGLMSEVVRNSTSKMADSDLYAMAVYLKNSGPASQASQTVADQSSNALGKTIYLSSCSACHGSDGSGQSHMFPPLAKNANVQSADPSTIIRVILQGVRTATTDRRPTPSAMPAYDWKLGDEEIAAVVSFVRNSWGNAASTVTASDVKDLRQTLHAATP